MNELLAKLRRLFESRPRPPAASIGEPADRPPPVAPEAPPVAQPPLFVAPPQREPATLDVDDLAEVRAALEAVAETPVEAPDPKAEVLPPIPQPTPTPASDSTPALPLAPTYEPAAMHEAVDDPATIADHAPSPSSRAQATVGDALVLTLGTPPVTFTVAKTSATLGRGQENTIRLDDLSVSRRHARIAYRQRGYWLSDLGSMGGTWVEGARLNAPRRLSAGEVIDIGLCRLTVGFTGGAAKGDTNKSTSTRSEVAGQLRRRR